MPSPFRTAVAILVCMIFTVIPANPAEQNAQAFSPCVVEQTQFHGWDAERLSNRWVTLIIVPKLGGRLMQVTFGGHDYLFVNPLYLGKYFPPSEGAAKGKWFNYGGDKNWPLPEGPGENQWPVASDVLDDGIYQLTPARTGPVDCGVNLQGPPDDRTGLQYFRYISIGAESPQIIFRAQMQNITGHEIKWSMQSVTQYNTADPRDPAKYNHDFWAFTPANPASVFNRKFDAHAGPIDHPSYSVRNNLFTLHWKYLEGEVGVDSTAGWVAVIDGVSSFAMLERFRFYPGADYPERASVIFYIDGPSLQLNDQGMPEISRTKLEDAPYYMEAELNSPLVVLPPGQTSVLQSEWFPTRMTPQFVNAAEAGMIGRELAVVPAPGGVRLTGYFGVFYAGRLVARVYDARGVALKPVDLARADPLEAVSLDSVVSLPPEAATVSLHLVDEHGLDRGSPGETEIMKGK